MEIITNISSDDLLDNMKNSSIDNQKHFANQINYVDFEKVLKILELWEYNFINLRNDINAGGLYLTEKEYLHEIDTRNTLTSEINENLILCYE